MIKMLEIFNVNVHYGGVHALRNISMTIAEGEFVAIIGANGAGKTTLLRTISGLKRITGGNIKFKNEEISQIEPERIVELGICHCPEHRHVWKHLTVLENLTLGAYVHRKRRQDVAQSLDRVWKYFPKLYERQRQLAGTLSGGEQQMLAVGRALMGKPSLLMLDEPSLGLAPVIVQDLARIFKQINEDGTTIVLVEQNANMALRLAERTYVIETGSIVKEGSSEELMNDDFISKAYLGGLTV